MRSDVSSWPRRRSVRRERAISVKRVRPICVVVALVVGGSLGWSGCANGSHRIFAGSEDAISYQALAAELAARPIAPGENLRISLLSKTEHASVHLVQVRWGEKPHIHESHDLSVFVLRGHGEMTMGHETRVIQEGDMVHVSAGLRHFFTNRSRSPAVAVLVFSPPFDGKDTKPVE
jgi:quercetin dioxygenase-like cupin family protein